MSFKFTVTDKPKPKLKRRGKYDDLLAAVRAASGDGKAVQIPATDANHAQQIRALISASFNRKGVRLTTTYQEGFLYVWLKEEAQ